MNLLNKIKIGFQKNESEIYLAASIITGVATVIFTAKQTVKAMDVIEKHKEAKDVTNYALENYPDEYTLADHKEENRKLIITTGVNLLKTYAVPALLGLVSIGCGLQSHKVSKERNIALASAYAATAQGFNSYRKNVVDKFGEQIDKELRHGVKEVEVTEEVEQPDGKKKKQKNKIMVRSNLDDNQFIFDELNENFERNGNFNRTFLLAQQQYANDRLRRDGFLFVNDVLQELGFEKTKAGQIDGWIYDYEGTAPGDGYVDFGIFEAYRENKREIVKENVKEGRPLDIGQYEQYVLLDFNATPNIWEHLTDHKKHQ